jgi:hypothetical protein
MSSTLRRRGEKPAPVRRLRGDSGAALIETALISPILFFLLNSIFEYGVLFRDVLGANDAVESGAKYGSVQGPDLNRLMSGGTELGWVTADYTIILNTRAGLAGISPNQIERIVVFKAGPASRGGPMQQVPAACKTDTTSIANVCNIYLMPTAFQKIEEGTPGFSYFACPSTTACGWNPETRNDGPQLASIDYLGVYVKLNRPPITGMVPVTRTIEAAAVHRLEPGQIS